MEATFTVDVPFEVPMLRFVVEMDSYRKGKRRISCYFDKGREMFALALMLESMDDLGRCAQLLAHSAAWTVEVLERWPRDEETGRLAGDMAALDAFVVGRPRFAACRQGAPAMLDSAENWPAEKQKGSK